MTDKPDRRVARTISNLWEALFSLLAEQDWADITVQMICDRANTGRSTFYAHFSTKQALLEAGFALNTQTIRDQVLARAATTPPDRLATVDWLIAHTADSRHHFRRLATSGAGGLILGRFRQTLATVLAAELAQRHRPTSGAALTFLTGGLFAVLEEALLRGEPLAPLAEPISHLILKGP